MERFFSDILKPGRYINREWNAIHKEWTNSKLKMALCFPDIYEIGMSHLGMKILYGILNQEEDVICERVFAPWKDMEENMRSEGGGLVSLESQKRLNEFDIIGFSLQHEMNYTDVLNMLDLGQVLIYARERGDADPLVIAGGPCTVNPEPMADFIDAFVIGEAEDVILEITRTVQGARYDVMGRREAILKELAKIEGVYVPFSNSQLSPLTVKKRIVRDLENSYFPTKPVVPYIQVVHDRIGIEIMRGCPHGCRFCQARKIFHPMRMRSVKSILEIAEKSIENTGYEEMSLLSLSTGDYPYLEELVGKLEERFKRTGVKISLPSLRVRRFNDNEMSNIIKRSGLTFAPEAGSDGLRSHLNKGMKNEDIIQKSSLFLKSGWKKVKLYFMIGLPGETYKDLDAIIELASQIKNVNLSVSPFIPKPHSEFEKEGMDGLGALKDKEAHLRSRRALLFCSGQKARNGTNRNLKIYFQSPEMSRLEAIVSRGDRRIGGVIYMAWQKGARLQAWTEYFDYTLWEECFEECAVDPEAYLKKKDKEARLPWDFIDVNSPFL
ncbi:TIGR03960 family B12-binding radical SAM protein [Candidatus Omnitrophota bacterium]